MNALLIAALLLPAYPVDEGERTGIRRLDWQRAVNEGARKGTKLPPGARWPGAKIQLHMKAHKDYRLTRESKPDPKLQAALEDILKRQRWRDYHVAVLDVTQPAKPRFAGVQADALQTPGSVAKLLGAAALLDQVAKRFPKIEDRERFLKNTKVAADEWLMPNHHEVPVVDGDKVAVRAVRRGDTFSLWEWMDHAISPSSNAAGTLVWREATLMKLLGPAYPPEKRDAALWSRWSKEEFTKAAFAAVDEPAARAGVPTDAFYLRLFFTRGGTRYLNGGESRASPRALVAWLLAVEQGRMVDPWASLELKKLMYLTRRRVRYVHAPELADSAVFFKSGSLYQCAPEPGFTCIQYRGNKTNVLNGLVEVKTERPGLPPLVYLVAVMSNELKKNAAIDHARLASEIHAHLVAHHGPAQ